MSTTTKNAEKKGTQWTTPEQLAFLQSRLPDYQAAQTQGGRKFSGFWATVFEYWFIHWPPGVLTEQEKADGMTEQEKATAAKKVILFLFSCNKSDELTDKTS
jgi:hypothetical protein